MTSGKDTSSETLPTPKEIADLKRLAAGIIRFQGNRFIKELLRSKHLRIGVTKDDFEHNLMEAIENGQLRLKDVEEWLALVEGWGDQHVYLYNLPSALRASLSGRRLRDRVRTAGLDGVWNAATVLAFPDEPTLTSISVVDSVLRLVWQKSSPGWTSVPEKDFSRQEDLDLIEYRAFRMLERRAISRFEAHLDRELAGLFIASPIQGAEHQDLVEKARMAIGQLVDLRALEANQVDVSVVSRNLDQQNVPSNARPTPAVKTQKSRLASGGAYVEFAASSPDRAYWEEPAIQDVRKSVRADQLTAFQGSDGVFIFQGTPGLDGLERSLRVQLYGKEDRVRLWARMSSTEVWTILEQLGTYQ